MGVLLGNIEDLAMSAWTIVCLVTGISIGSILTWQRQGNIEPDITPNPPDTALYDRLRDEFDTTVDSDDGVAPPGGGGL